MTGENALNEALSLINEAKTDKDFVSKYNDNLFATGERQIDYCAFRFELPEDYYLILDFANFVLEDFSIVCYGHEDIVLREQG